MSSRPSQPVNRPVLISLCLMLACVAVAVLGTATAKGGFYQMVLCAANNGSNSFQTATNTTSSQNPGGIFSIENHCGPAPFPAGNNAFIRIVENQAGGTAGMNAYGSVSWTVPPWVAIRAAGGYTRQPNAFNDGWRARFWGEGFDGSGPHNILMQGAGVGNGGIFWNPTSTFASHLWPFGGWGSYRRFIYEMTCVRSAGCDRTNFNATDANTFILVLSDEQNSQVGFTGSTPFMSGQWVRGTQTATYKWTENGSGIRFERLKIDGSDRFVIDHIAAGQCNRDSWGGVGEFARVFQPCPTASNISRSHTFNTATLPDGTHNMKVCTQDYGQWQGLAGTSSESCADRVVRTDNTAPGAPSGLHVTSSNPNRYLDRFGAQFSLPPNQGSPITKVHYQVVNAGGDVVKPTQTLSATNPTALNGIEGPAKAGAYRLRVWLEDQVGLAGPASTAEIPRDTTPPAAPQELSVTHPTTSRAADGFDLRWRNVLDNGSPISFVHYQVVNAAGGVVVSTQTIAGENVQAIQNLETPEDRGGYTLRAWLEDAEGNVGVPTAAPLTYQCMRSRVGGGNALTGGLGANGASGEVVKQGSGSTLRGRLSGTGGGLAGAPLCVFSRVVTSQAREFIGLAMSGPDGGYQFPIPAGASRDLTVLYRSGSREVATRATLQTIVRPTFKVRRKVVYNKRFAKFTGSIPGPDNDKVVVVLQVRRGKGWLAFRRYRTRRNGRFTVGYRFNRTTVPTKYVMRAQVRTQAGYPYLQGNSKHLTLIVRPKRPRRTSRASAAPRGGTVPVRQGPAGKRRGHPCRDIGFCG